MRLPSMQRTTAWTAGMGIVLAGVPMVAAHASDNGREGRFVPSAHGAIAVGDAKAKRPELRKKKKKKPVTATVNATWSVERSGEVNGGTETEKITFTVKDAVAKFAGPRDTVADGEGTVKIEYQAHFFTDDRSWHAGCDREERTTTATYSGDLSFGVFPVNNRTVGGKSQRLGNGWGIELADPPADRKERKLFKPVTTGYYEDWESIAMQTCNKFPINTPLGGWNRYFVSSWVASGKLNGGGKGVMLTQPHSGFGQTGSVKGTIKFSQSVENRGGPVGGGSLN